MRIGSDATFRRTRKFQGIYMHILTAIWNAFYQTFGQRALLAVLVLPAMVAGFTLHEYAHAWVAVHLGDPTPKWDGRLTLNPLKHLDPLGTILVFIAFIGWAKPVRWNPSYLRVSRRLGTLLVAAAGPLSNLALALVGAVTLRGLLAEGMLSPSWGGLPNLTDFLVVFVAFNVLLFVFNLIPLPPLDGFSVLSSLAPRGWYKTLQFLQQYGTLVLLALLFIPGSPLGGLINDTVNVLVHVLLG